MNADLAAWAERYEVIVLEDCDGAGKTTLAIALSDAPLEFVLARAELSEAFESHRKHPAYLARNSQTC